MKRPLQVLIAVALAWFATDTLLVDPRCCWAQESSRDDRRSGRSRFGDRGDWRSSRSRGEDDRRSDDRRSDERSGSGSSSSTSSGSSTSTAASGASSGMNLQSWAANLVRQNDKNGDMILQKDEQGFLGSKAAAQDLNHDGMITVDELVMYHSGGASAAGAPASAPSTPTTISESSSGTRSTDSSRDTRGSATSDALSKRVLYGSASGATSSGKEGDKRRSYRFSRATDKLPTGLPSWFRTRDANGDGQVSMSEYSRSWNAGLVSEFRRYDLNDDGIITAKEASKQR